MNYKPRNLKREAAMAAMYSDDRQTLQAVANAFGISRERVRQILTRMGVPRRGRGRQSNA